MKKILIMGLILINSFLIYARQETVVTVVENLKFSKVNLLNIVDLPVAKGVLKLESPQNDIGKEIDLIVTGGSLNEFGSQITPWKIILDKDSKEVRSTTQYLHYYVVIAPNRLRGRNQGSYTGIFEFDLHIGKNRRREIRERIKARNLSPEKAAKVKEILTKIVKKPKKAKQKYGSSSELQKEALKSKVKNIENKRKKLNSVLEKVRKVSVDARLDLFEPIELTVESVKGVVVDNMVVKFPFIIKSSKKFEEGDYISYSTGTDIDLDKDGRVDTRVTTSKLEVGSKKVSGDIQVDGERLGTDGRYKETIYVRVARDI